MNYEEMLNRGRSSMPKETGDNHRFEIPKLKARLVGNKTLIQNFKELSFTLNRSENLLSKQLLKEIGTYGTIEKQGLLLNGKFSLVFLNQKLKDYCKKYILCEKCNRPDTKIIKNGTFLKCEACGFTKPL